MQTWVPGIEETGLLAMLGIKLVGMNIDFTLNGCVMAKQFIITAKRANAKKRPKKGEIPDVLVTIEAR